MRYRKPSLSFAHPTDFVVNFDKGDGDEPIMSSYLQQFSTPELDRLTTTKRKGNVEIHLASPFTTNSMINVVVIIDDQFEVYLDLLEMFYKSPVFEQITCFLCDEDGSPKVGLIYESAQLTHIGAMSMETKAEGFVSVTVDLEITYEKFKYERIKA